jgi:hypothetical protein
LAGGLAALHVDAAPRATVGQAQQLVELIQHLVAALDHDGSASYRSRNVGVRLVLLGRFGRLRAGENRR